MQHQWYDQRERQGVSEGENLRQAAFITELFGVAISAQQKDDEVRPRCSPSFFCNTASVTTWIEDPDEPGCKFHLKLSEA